MMDAHSPEMILLTDIRDTLQEIAAHIYSLRVDMAAMAAYYQQMMAAAEAPQVESLPIGFPGREQLAAAGITAVSQIPRTIRSIEKLVDEDTDLAMQIAREIGSNSRKL